LRRLPCFPPPGHKGVFGKRPHHVRPRRLLTEGPGDSFFFSSKSMFSRIDSGPFRPEETLGHCHVRLTRPSTASRWGCGSRLRRIWIALASAIVLLQVALYRCTLFMYVWRTPSPPSRSLKGTGTGESVREALRWRSRVQVAVVRTYPCPASAQEGCPPLQCRLQYKYISFFNLNCNLSINVEYARWSADLCLSAWLSVCEQVYALHI
jgi:hypothetical protein